MNFEYKRLSSFDNCSLSVELKSKLALYGLYHKGENDIVQCFSCKVSFSWKCKNVLEKHFKKSPNCKFLLKLDNSNYPIDKNLLDLPDIPYDTCGLVDSFENRLNTFKNWTHVIPGKKFAHAGFQYTNQSDIVYCSSCDVQINNWSNNDDPWIEHILYSKNCTFVKDYLKTKTGRLHSFKTWKGESGINALVSAGFYYTQYNDEIETICCNSVINNWKPQQDVMEIHKKLEPNCLVVSLFHTIPTNFLESFIGVNIPEEAKSRLAKENIYYNQDKQTIVCDKCNFYTKLLAYNEFVHDSKCIKTL